MHFDDRLVTVLRMRTTGSAAAGIQFRQLLDLLGTMPVTAKGPRVDAAFDRLGELSTMIATGERIAMLRDPGMRVRNPRLVALLADCEPSVAAAVIEVAQLDDNEWVDLVPALPIHARSLLRQRSDFSPWVEGAFKRLGMAPRSLPPSQIETTASEPAAYQVARDPAEIGAIVRRIEDFRKSRLPSETLVSDQASGPKKSEKAGERTPQRTNAFDFATDSKGRIIWSDPGMAPMAVGLQLTSQDWSQGQHINAALNKHQPISQTMLALEGSPAIAGTWQVDAKPCFDPLSGRFTGIAGRMRRPAELADDSAESSDLADSEADRMRQVLHELRTPVGAIQGFAEVIQQQLFGTAPHEYRALAASIAADAAKILAGFEELDRLAKLESGKLEVEGGDCDIASVLASTIEQLKPFTSARGGGFDLKIDHGTGNHKIIMSQTAAERLVWRLLGSIAGVANPGERLELSMSEANQGITVKIQLPAGLAERDEKDAKPLPGASTSSALFTGMFGTDFTFRLAGAEAKAAGGSLTRRGNAMDLQLRA